MAHKEVGASTCCGDCIPIVEWVNELVLVARLRHLVLEP